MIIADAGMLIIAATCCSPLAACDDPADQAFTLASALTSSQFVQAGGMRQYKTRRQIHVSLLTDSQSKSKTGVSTKYCYQQASSGLGSVGWLVGWIVGVLQLVGSEKDKYSIL